MHTREEMRAKLSGVRGAYDWFVAVMMHFIDEDGIGEELMEYIDMNPEATSSDVIKEQIRIMHGVAL